VGDQSEIEPSNPISCGHSTYLLLCFRFLFARPRDDVVRAGSSPLLLCFYLDLYTSLRPPFFFFNFVFVAQCRFPFILLGRLKTHRRPRHMSLCLWRGSTCSIIKKLISILIDYNFKDLVYMDNFFFPSTVFNESRVLLRKFKFTQKS
jgi:hypothetical protein